MKSKYTFFLLFTILLLTLTGLTTKNKRLKADQIDLICKYDNRSNLRYNDNKSWIDEKYINNKHSQNINRLISNKSNYNNLNNIKSHVYYYKGDYYLLVTADWDGNFKDNVNYDILKTYANDSTIRIGKNNDPTIKEILYFINDYSSSDQYTFRYRLENTGYHLIK